MNKTFSVLICTYQRHELLRKSLCSLVEHTDEKPDEIIVVNGGDERADEVVEQFIKKTAIKIRLIKTQNKNLATSRNVGLPYCCGDIIALTDDDAEVFPDWVTRMKKTHEDHPEAGAVGGVVIGTNVDAIVGKVSDALTFPAWPSPRYVRVVPGVNSSFKREIIDKVGQQDEKLFRGEDVDFCWRVQNLGYKVYYDPEIKVYHHHRATLKSFLHQYYMYGKAYYLVRKKWKTMYSIFPHGLRCIKDFLKIFNFIAGMIYEPLTNARKIVGWKNRLWGIPIIFLAVGAWRCGILKQKWELMQTKGSNFRS